MSKKINRNDPCPCGSGKKYKQCCLNKETVKTYTPEGKRKFKAKVISSEAPSFLSSLGSAGSSSREFKATSKSYEQTAKSSNDAERKEEESAKNTRFKKIPSKKPGDDFQATDQDFRVDEK